MSLLGGCGSPFYNSVILYDELAFKTGVTPKDYQNKGQLRPTLSLSTDDAGNQSFKMTDSKGLNASSTAMLAPPHISSVGARDAWVQVTSGTFNVTESLSPTKETDGTLMGEQIVKLLAPDGAAGIRIVWPFVVDFNHIQVTWFGADPVFGTFNIGAIHTGLGFPTVALKMVDCEGTVFPANAVGLSGFENGVTISQPLKLANFFGAGNPSTAVFKPMGIANLVLDLTFSNGDTPILIGSAAFGTDQRALVPA